MSIFGKIKDAIFGHAAAAPASSGAQAGASAGKLASATGASATASAGTNASSSTTGAATPGSGGSSGGARQVDVAAVLDQAVEDNGQELNWRTSIVDLMKALDLDSSLAARKELAADLNYTGDTSDSATMNVWLHKQVMAKLAEKGGKVPDSLKA